VVASCQPSVAELRNSDISASVTGCPASSISIQPYGSGMCSQPTVASPMLSSRSGLTPETTRRNSLQMYSSPYTSEVLLCSAVLARLSSPVSIRLPGSAANRSGPAAAPRAMFSSSTRVSSGSCTAS
jgi:hypothetical protein